MRFVEFKVLKEQANKNIVVIGDSIAVGIANAGHVDGQYAVGGSNTNQVLNFVQKFIQSGNAKGATVILSSGAANSSKVTTEDGKTIQQETFGPINSQIKLLKDAGASVVLVGVASKQTPPQKPTKYTNGQSWTIDYTGVNQQLASIASSNGAKFLGPLEQYDNTISQHDGIHPFNGYSKLFQDGSAGAAPSQSGQGADEKSTKDSKFQIDMPGGQPDNLTRGLAGAAPGQNSTTSWGRSGTAIADIQKALQALGYDLGPTGVDGIRGPYTKAAVKAFQAKNNLTVDGDPGIETIPVLNKAIASRPDIASKLQKSTAADVKPMQPTASKQKINPQQKVQNAVDPKEIAGYLNSKGLDKNHVIGILANIKAESGFDSGVIGDNGTSGGLFQHHADRFANMINTAGGDDKWQKNWQKQIDFALSEPAGIKYQKLQFNSPDDAIAWWTRYFEIPANVDQQVASRISKQPSIA